MLIIVRLNVLKKKKKNYDNCHIIYILKYNYKVNAKHT